MAVVGCAVLGAAGAPTAPRELWVEAKIEDSRLAYHLQLLWFVS